MDQLESPSKRRKEDHEHYKYDQAPPIVPPPYAHSAHGPPPQHYYHAHHSNVGAPPPPPPPPPPNYQSWQGNSSKGPSPPHHHGYLPGSPPMYHSHGPPVDYPYHNNGPHLSQQYQYRENKVIGPNMPVTSGAHASHSSSYEYPPTNLRNSSMPLNGGPPSNPQSISSTVAESRSINVNSFVPSTETYDSRVQQQGTDETTRGSYRCGRCGVPKKGHICPYQPKLKRRADEPIPEMKNAACQVEMDEFLVLRRLNLEIQGLPETYTSEPIGNVGYDVAPDISNLQTTEVPDANIKKEGNLNVQVQNDADATSGSGSMTNSAAPSGDPETADDEQKN